MIEKNRYILRYIDWFMVLIYLFLVFFGWINIYSVSIEKAEKQLIWILLSFLLILIVFLFNPNDYKYISFPFYLVTILLLIGVLIFGKSINGAKAWYILGPINFQPSEISKISTSLIISKLISQSNKSSNLDFKIIIIIFIIIIIPVILILLQPDPGSILSFAAFILVFYRENIISIKSIIICFFLMIISILLIVYSQLLIIGIISGIFILYNIFTFFFIKKMQKLYSVFLIFFSFILVFPFVFNKLLKQHHKNRITILFKNEFDKKYRNNVGYNLLASKAAIASGEFLGKGFRHGTVTKGKFVPEQFTDYIFCTVSEEWGFVGGTFLIIVYIFFIGRIYYLSENNKDDFSRIFGYSTANFLLLNVAINLGMVTGLIPTIGIPLPFFSYGGSSLWSFTVLVFIFIRLNLYDRISLI